MTALEDGYNYTLRSTRSSQYEKVDFFEGIEEYYKVVEITTIDLVNEWREPFKNLIQLIFTNSRDLKNKTDKSN